jgi:cytoskeleton protein RodZ
MGSFGEHMRREREMRGITLESISRATKIRTHILEALEKEEFEKLPGGIVNKGFVRSYARFLGMNEEQVLKEFIEVAGYPEQSLPDPPVPRRPEIRQPKERRSWSGVATVVVCAIALLFGGWKTAHIVRHAAGATWSGVHGTRSQPTMTPAESVVTKHVSSSSSQTNEQPAGVPATDQPENAEPTMLKPASRTTTTPASELVPAAVTTGTKKFVILVRANEPAWVSITADGKPFLEGVLKRKKKIHAYSQVVLKTNNAGALAVSLNGKPLAPLGDQDQQTTITFTPDGAVSSERGEVDSEGLPHVSGGSDRQEPTRDDPQRPQSPGSSDTPPAK